MAFYEEKQPWGTTKYILDSYTSFHTEKQKVELITNPTYGQMLFLDGVLQSTTSDQELYHDALSALVEHPRRVLIGGSAEGWLAQKLLKRSGVQSVVMVDWDRELVQYIKENTDWSPGIWKDSRFRYSSKNIVSFLEETTLDFDSIYLDLLDLNTEEERFLMTHILHWACQKILYPGNTLCMNVGRDKATAEAFSKRDGFVGSVREVLVPSFQEPWYLVKLVRT